MPNPNLRFPTLLLILSHRTTLNNTRSLLENIHLRSGEVSRADAALEKEIELCERAALGLGDAEVGVDYAEEADSCPLGCMLLVCKGGKRYWEGSVFIFVFGGWECSGECLQRNRRSCPSSMHQGLTCKVSGRYI